MIISFCISLFGGCNMSNKDKDLNTAKKEAYQNWAKSRIELYLQLANDNYKSGRLDEAKEKIREVLKLDSENLTAHLFLAKINIEQGLFDVASKELEYVIAKNSQSYEAFYMLGVALEYKDKLDQSLANYEQAAQLNPAEMAPILAAAEVMVKQDRAGEALMLLERKMNMSADKPQTYELAGRISMMLGKYDRAVDYFQKACDVDFKNKRYPEMLAQAQKEACDTDTAAETMRRILSSRTPAECQPWMYMFLGDCEMQNGNPEKAFSAYRTACKLDRQDISTWVSMAQACIVMKKYYTAANATVEALRIKPDDLQANLVYAYSLMKLNRAKQAAERLEQVTRLYPQNGTLCYLLARAYQMQGDNERARRLLGVAMQGNPESQLARQMLAKGN